MQPTDFFPHVDAPATEWESAARELFHRVPGGSGSLGRVEDLGVWLSSCHGAVPARPIQSPKLVIFAGDHGVAAKGVSALEPGHSVEMAQAIEQGTSVTNSIARSVDVPVRLVDISLDHDVFGDERVSKGCGSIDVEDAMSEEELRRALEIGIALADAEIDSGADLLLVADLGVGNTTAASVITGIYSHTEPVVIAGRGSGIDDEGWKRKVAAIRNAMFRVRGKQGEIMTVLQKVSSPDIAAMAAFIAQAAVRRTPVVLDGLTSAAAAIVADRLAPGVRKWLVASHQTTEPAHELALQYLSLSPLTNLRMSSGGGIGALGAVPTLRMAADIMNDLQAE